MASLFRPYYVRTDPQTGKKVRRRLKKWYIKYRDADGVLQKVPGLTDKVATQTKAVELERKAERRKAGLADPFEEKIKIPLTQHLGDYQAYLLNKGNTEAHAKKTASRIRRILSGCKFRFIPDLSASRVQEFLASIRQDGKPLTALEAAKEWFTKAEAAQALSLKPPAFAALVHRHRLEATGNGKARRFPRATVEALRDRLQRGRSIGTANHYLTAMKGFTRWLVRDRRMPDNPLAHLSGGNEKLDRRHDRRALSAEELQAILEAAKDSTVAFRGLAGPDWAMLYAVAMGTGFRASELAILTPGLFDLTAIRPW